METECNLNLLISSELKASEMHSETPLLRSIELARRLQQKGLSLPNPNLAEILVSHLCFSQNTPSLWKLLDQAMASRLISPLQTLALLTQKVVPERKVQPGAYRLYLELLRRYALVLPPSGVNIPGGDMIVKSINDTLQLSNTYGVEEIDLGRAIVFVNFTIINNLIDSSLEDCDFEMKNQNLIINNALLALEIVEKITADKRVQVFLRLVYMNMPEKFKSLLDKIELIEAHLSNINSPNTNNVASNLVSNIQNSVNEAINQLEKHPQLGVLFNTRQKSSISNFCNNFGFGNNSTCWIPFDVFLENAMDGKHLHVISAIEILTELIKTLQVINEATWQETFQALWISALRQVQRGRVQIEGPIPLLNARLCILLAIVPLSIAPLVNNNNNNKENEIIIRDGLIYSIKVLSQFSTLLVPHPSSVTMANEAATKAAVFVSNMKIGTVNPTIKAVGNMQHLIVESCIARNLIDTSAYFWHGYVVPTQSLQKESFQKDSPWSAFMDGAPLNDQLETALMVTPAPSVAELEKLYRIALSGSDKDKSTASKILCGASLIRGWNFQEHAVGMVIKLLSPLDSLEDSENRKHYIRNMSMLNAILSAMSSVDTVHILSLYGLVPEVAAALMPICETFGSLAPLSTHKSCVPEEVTVFSVFSYAFLLLLRLWKFYRPPQEHCIASRGAHVRHELTLDYLLLLRNSLVSIQNPNSKPVYIEFFPKLRAWYFQNQACISSTLSGLSNKNPVHQVANMILNMIWSGSALSNSSTSGSVGPVVSTDDSSSQSQSQSQRPTLPAWEVLEALPFVLDAALTACAYGQLSSRDVTTGLRHIVDFLPASLAVIVSYFSAEITRGIWKPVHLNGIDWPSPAANLLTIDREIKEILASAGVVVPCIYPRGKEPMLPLPIAVLVSLTITFKLDRNYDYIQGIIGQALENCASTSSWPSMPIVGALWTQKAKRWHDFIVLSCTRAPFSRDKNTVSQLIKSCFTSFLTSGPLTLLGHVQVERGARSPVAPGLLFIHSCRTFLDIHHVSEVIFKFILDLASETADCCVRNDGVRNGGSLASAVVRMRQVASLGASLLVATGGMKLVQVLYEETFPTLLLLGEEENCFKKPVHDILSGYAIAYLLVYSGVFVWGFGETSPAFTWVFSSRRARVFGRHMDFLARVMEVNLEPRYQPGAWKAYVLCFISCVVRFAPVWIKEVKLETLRNLAKGLRRWNECQLAIALLEQAGPAAMSAIVEALS
ncbi:hypothetical protein LUZ60_004050 [Juncus effusus]|nr:hypothetical protein LUZ60_004050 [Juncus effusus]